MDNHYIKKISVGLVLFSLLSVNGFYFLLTAQVLSVNNKYLNRIDLTLNFFDKNPTYSTTLTPEELEVSVSTYDPWIRSACQKHSLDPALVKAVILAESKFDPMAVSPRGAVGLMQID